MEKDTKKKYKNRGLTIFSRFLFLALVFVSILFMSMIGVMGVIPLPVFVLFLVVYALFVLVGGVFQWKRHVKAGYKWFFNIFSILFLVVFSFGIFYIQDTFDFMNQIRDSGYQTDYYYVMVREDAPYQELRDVEGKTIGTTPMETENYQEAFSKLQNELSFSEKTYQDAVVMGQDLLDTNLEVIFISNVYCDIVEDAISSFEEETRVLYTISVDTKEEVEKKDVAVKEEPFNIYISGIDIYGKISSVSRSDVNMVVTVNPTTHEILLTSIPRDYYVQLHGTTGLKDKLTHAGVYGINTSVQTVEDLLDIDINYYVRVNFTTLIELVDAIGGIDVYSDYEFTSRHGNYHFVKGLNHMNGKQALGFVRERYAFADGDHQRVKNQQAVLMGIFEKLTSSTALITNYSTILDTLGNSFQTNMGSDKIYSLINLQLSKMPNWTISSISLDGSNAYRYTYTYPVQELYVMDPDYESVQMAHDKILTTMGK